MDLLNVKILLDSGRPTSPQRMVRLRSFWLCSQLMIAVLAVTLRAHADQPSLEATNFWSYRPVQVPPIPAVKRADWCRNPIDHFILARLERAGLAPAGRASRVTLLRRLHYTLTGLPPTPEEVRAFLADRSLDAYQRVVNRLLQSPHYGEQWARHWLDLVRYAETNSFERDAAKPYVWRYRDYIIRAFNEDMPYDQFIRMQLAGDELKETSPASIIATGYYRLGLWDDEPSDPQRAYFDGLDDILTTTSQTFLAMTINCARCHDHKIDPIPQVDYYRILAFFSNIKHYGKRSPTSVNANSVRQISHDGQPILALCVKERGRQPPETFVLERGNPLARGKKVEPGFPSIFSPPAPRIVSPAHGESTGRRLALANWIASRENPRTARVLVNRLWQFQLGRGLVRTPNDFGLGGSRPSHPLLLDWLAGELIRGDWKIKRLQQLIVMSNTFQMASTATATTQSKDPANELFGHYPMRRLSAEEIRDSILAVSGQLNARAIGGPSVYTIMPQAVLAGQSRPGAGWGVSPLDQRNRRSLYIHSKRSLIPPLLASFDFADTDATCPVRFTTTQPTQALAMLNSPFIERQAQHFAESLSRQSTGVSGQVRTVLWRILQHEPTTAEIRQGTRLIESLQRQDRMSARDALKAFCLVALNLNAFIFID